MPKFKIDGEEYNSDDLSADDMNHFLAFQFVDNEIRSLRMKIAAMETAKIGYAKELKSRLNGIDETQGEIELPDTLNFE